MQALKAIVLVFLSMAIAVSAKPQDLKLKQTKARKELISRGPYLQMTSSTGTWIRYKTSEPMITSIKYSEIAPAAQNFSFSDELLKTEHEVFLPGLKADTRYIYSINAFDKSKQVALGRGSYYFKTAPSQNGLNTDAIRVCVLPDLYSKEIINSKKNIIQGVFNKINPRNVHELFTKFNQQADLDLILTLGNNSSSGLDKDYNKTLFAPYELELSSAPVFPVPGAKDVPYEIAKHGFLTKSYPLPRGAYYDNFTLPTHGELGGVASNTEAYYSFNYGFAHFIMLDTCDSHELGWSYEELLKNQIKPVLRYGNKMFAWLKEDLEAVKKAHADKVARPWVVVVMHHSAGDRDFWARWVQQNIVGVLESFDVDLVLSAGVENYSSKHPEEGAQKPTYISIGSLPLGFGFMEISPTELEFKFISQSKQKDVGVEPHEIRIVESFKLLKQKADEVGVEESSSSKN